MKCTFWILLSSILLFSCGKNSTIQETEALRQVALQSHEYREMKNLYANYKTYQESNYDSIFRAVRANKISLLEFQKSKMDIKSKSNSLLQLANQAAKRFRNKYPLKTIGLQPMELYELVNSSKE